MEHGGILPYIILTVIGWIIDRIVKASKEQKKTIDNNQLPDLANQPSPFASGSGKLATPVSQTNMARSGMSSANPKGIQAKFDAQQAANKLTQPEKRASFQESQDKAAQQDNPYTAIQSSPAVAVTSKNRSTAATPFEKTLSSMPTMKAAIVSAVIFSNALDRPYGGKQNPLMLRKRR